MKKGHKHTPESIERIKKSKIGLKFSKQHSMAISLSLKGKKKSVNHRKAISKGVKLFYSCNKPTVAEENMN